MKPITAFYLHECPYCKKAKAAIEELIAENPQYGQVPITWYEETEQPEAIAGHDFYYVPSMFIGTEKLYEAQTGQSYDEIKARVQLVLDKSLSM